MPTTEFPAEETILTFGSEDLEEVRSVRNRTLRLRRFVELAILGGGAEAGSRHACAEPGGGD